MLFLGVFTQDVVSYVAGVKALKDEIRRYGLPEESNDGAEYRRRAYRFAGLTKSPWIAEARFGDDKAVVINVSSTGALLRTPGACRNVTICGALTHSRNGDHA